MDIKSNTTREREGLETPDVLNGTLKVLPKFNGNISEVDWRTSIQENDPLKRYGYVYDGLSRQKAGFYQKEEIESSKEYYEKMEYDINGNSRRLKRSEQLLLGSTTALAIDNLKYDYTGNRLTKVTDEQQNPSGYPYFSTTQIIEYDNNALTGNGNMTDDKDKNISNIKYNYLNLATFVDAVTGGGFPYLDPEGQKHNYKYRADGIKY